MWMQMVEVWYQRNIERMALSNSDELILSMQQVSDHANHIPLSFAIS